MPSHAQPGPLQPMIVSASLNAEERGELFVQRAADGEILLRLDDLPRLGLLPLAPDAPGTSTIDGETHIRLSALPGLTWRLDERTQRMELMAAADLMPRRAVEARSRTRPIDHPTGHSAFLNWAIQRTGGDGLDNHGILDAYSLEAGARRGAFLLQTSGNTTADGRRFVRLMTSLTFDRPQDLQRWTAGDLTLTPSELGGGALVGGISLSKYFGMDPYRIRYPLGLVQGRANLPSDVDVYVDGQLVRNERVRPGEFEIRDLRTQQGARSVQLVVRDPYGRVETFDYSLYATQDLLQPGLHEYQYAAGVMRRNFGEASAEYGPLAYSAWHRYGLSEALTVGAHAQGRSGLLNAGPQFTARLGPAGVLSAGLAFSHAEGVASRAGTLRHTYQTDQWAIGAAWRHEAPGYAVLSELPAVSNRKATATVHGSRHWPGVGSFSLSRTRQTVHAMEHVPLPAGYAMTSQAAREVTSLGYSTFLPQARAHVRASLSRVLDDRGARTEVSLGITLVLDHDHSASIESRHSQGEDIQSVRLRRPLPAAEGWGYDIGADLTDRQDGPSERLESADTQYQGRHGILRGTYRRWDAGTGRQSSLRLAASGGLAWVEGRTYLTRPIRDSFAVARLGADLAEVPVTVDGNRVGVTDARGEVFLPGLFGYREAEIAMDPQALPIDYSVPRVRRHVMLPARSGAVIDFDARRVRAVTGRLAGLPPPGITNIRITAGQQAIEATTGRDGALYLENIPAGRHAAEAGPPGARCQFTLDVPPDDAWFIELGEIACEPVTSAAR